MARVFTDSEIERIILLAWADSVSFEAICNEFDITHNQTVQLMRTHQSPKTYGRWRERVAKRRIQNKSKHEKKRSITHAHEKLPT